MAAVEIRDVWKSFGTTDVIRGVSIDIADGEFVVLVGPSGCGKSTLLRSIAGLEAVTRGEIMINGRNVTDLPPKRRDVAMVFQNYALYPHMTVRENMGFALEAAQRPEGEIDRRVEESRRHSRASGAARPLSAPAVRRPASARGHGARHRARPQGLSVRRAVVQSRRQAARADARGDQGLHQRLGATTVYVTHDQIEAMTMADRIVVMNGASSSRSARHLNSLIGRQSVCSHLHRLAGHEPHRRSHRAPRRRAIVPQQARAAASASDDSAFEFRRAQRHLRHSTRASGHR